jgi:hypothetical protein
LAPTYAAVPEEVFRRRAELTSGAFDLYELYCKHRNRDTGRCDPSIGYLAAQLHLSYNHVSDLKCELVEKGWVERLGRRAVDLLVGFKPPKVVKIGRANSGKNPEFGGGAGARIPEKIRNRIPENSGVGAASPYSEHLSQPDDDDNASSSALLDFYSEQTGNAVRASDRRTAAELSRHPEHVAKAGIVLSLLRARSRINSLKYCVGAVEECAENRAGEEYLRYLLGQLERKRRQVQPGLPGVEAEVAEGNFVGCDEPGVERKAGGGG